MIHKYTLQKYTGVSSRLQCPKCESKGVLAVYIDTETGQALSKDVGRCNREDKCGYHYTPSQYFEDNPTSRDNKPHTSTPQRNRVQTAPKVSKVINTIPKGYLSRSLGYDSHFVHFLSSLFDRYTLNSPIIERIMQNYYLGETKSKGIIFWQVDTNGRIRTGKIMHYNHDTGKRVKSDNGTIDWVHSKLKRSNILPTEWELSQCLFGEHLLAKRPNDAVCIVESEKSAIIASGVMPDSIWLATGGKQNFKADKCRILKGRAVTVYPDLGAYDEWEKKTKSISVEVGCKMNISNLLEDIATDTDRYNGLDIADYLTRELMQAQPLKSISIPFTKEELVLHSLIDKNPNLATLITSLDMISATTNQALRLRA